MSSEPLISRNRNHVTSASGSAKRTLISRNFRGYVSRFMRPTAGAKNDVTPMILRSASGNDPVPDRQAGGDRRLGRRPFAGDGRASHHARMPRGVPGPAAVKHAPVVPHDGIPRPPAMLEHALGPRGVREQLVEQPARLLVV